jgi:hypothetical protein
MIAKISLVIFFLCLVSCSANKNNINPWTTIVKQIVTNGVSR